MSVFSDIEFTACKIDFLVIWLTAGKMLVSEGVLNIKVLLFSTTKANPSLRDFDESIRILIWR